MFPKHEVSISTEIGRSQANRRLDLIWIGLLGRPDYKEIPLIAPVAQSGMGWIA